VTDVDERGRRFAQDIATMRIADPAPGRPELWLRVGVGLMVLGVLAAVVAALRSQGSCDPFEQRDAMGVALGGIAVAVVGAAVYLRYAVTQVLRFWLARVTYDIETPVDERELQP
jgi:hypothetical protein